MQKFAKISNFKSIFKDLFIFLCVYKCLAYMHGSQKSVTHPLELK